jgi:hypothetical protein
MLTIQKYRVKRAGTSHGRDSGEVWSFVGCKEKTACLQNASTGCGDAFAFMASGREANLLFLLPSGSGALVGELNEFHAVPDSAAAFQFRDR